MTAKRHAAVEANSSGKLRLGSLEAVAAEVVAAVTAGLDLEKTWGPASWIHHQLHK